MSNLKILDERQQRANSNEYDSREAPKENKRGGKGGSADPPQAKPSEGVSIFDFLENKIPKTTVKQSSYSQNEQRFENNIFIIKLSKVQ